MDHSERVHSRVKRWMPRIWGFVVGAAALVGGGIIVSAAFTDSAARPDGSDLEFVYPYDL